MDIPQILDIVIRGVGPSALGVYSVYKTRKTIKKQHENRIKESGLLEASRMSLNEIDIRRALRVIALSKDPPEDIESLRDTPRLLKVAIELDGFCRAYTGFIKEYNKYPDSARNNFYRSLGVKIYIDERYLGNKRFEWDSLKTSKFNSL